MNADTWRNLAGAATKAGLTALGSALLPGSPLVGRALGMAASELVSDHLRGQPTSYHPAAGEALRRTHEIIEEKGRYDEIRLPRNFSYDEVSERGTGLLEPPVVGEFQSMLDALQELRDAYGKPMRVTSCWRSLSHPAEASKGPDALHRHHLAAVDIGCHGLGQRHLLHLALDQGWTGIGVNARGPAGSRFLHLDRLIAHPGIWSY